jgi:polar amino acid transport system substrate-binding protein
MVTAGDADILIANTLPNSPDPALAYVLGVDSTCFFVRKDYDWRYNGMQSLQSVRLGVIQDYHYDGKGPLDAYIRSSIGDRSKVISAKGADALKNNFNMLVAGRLDVLLENCNVGSSAIQRQGLQNQVVNADLMPTYKDNLYVSFAPDNPKSAQRMQLLMEGVERLRASNQLQPILQKYAVSDWVTEPASELQH